MPSFPSSTGAVSVNSTTAAGTSTNAATPERYPFSKLSVIMPALNEAMTIERMIRRVLDVEVPVLLELVIVDDGSTDKTWQIIQSMGDERIVGVRKEHNQGKGSALRAGIAACSGDVVVFQDADLEYDPAAFSSMLNRLTTNQDGAVYGSRFLGQISGMRRRNRIANRTLSLLTNVLFGSSLTDMETCYKMLKKDVLVDLELTSHGFDIEPEITTALLRSGRAIVEVPIDYVARTSEDGKKIGVGDGLEAIATLLRARFR